MKLPIHSVCFVITISFILSGCQTLDIRGQNIDDATIKQIENNKISKSEVENVLGTPTIISDYTNNTWYYIQRILSRRAWFNPVVTEQKVVKVTFDSSNYLEEIAVLTNSQKNINTVSEYTKTHGTELNPIQKFVKNIGRFNKTNDGKKKRKNTF